jgi:hypothetical protein
VPAVQEGCFKATSAAVRPRAQRRSAQGARCVAGRRSCANHLTVYPCLEWAPARGLHSHPEDNREALMQIAKGGSEPFWLDPLPRQPVDKMQAPQGSYWRPDEAHLESRRLTPPQGIGKTPKLQIPQCNVLPVFQGPTFGSCSTLAGAEPGHTSLTAGHPPSPVPNHCGSRVQPSYCPSTLTDAPETLAHTSYETHLALLSSAQLAATSFKSVHRALCVQPSVCRCTRYLLQ